MPFDSPVNVSSVPQRSPFRYPGGKSWFVPLARKWLAWNRKDTFVEMFAGGASIGLAAVFEGHCERAVFVENDPRVAAVWKAIFDGDAARLCKRIRGFDFTKDAVVQLLADDEPSDPAEAAFRTIVRNRANRGGIMSPTAGLMKRGENDKGISSRWYPETIAKRIEAIDSLRHRFSLHEGDAIAFAESFDGDAKWFVDPPYVKAGARLYAHNKIDHGALFRAVDSRCEDFLMTYDDDDMIRSLCESHGFRSRKVAMQSAHLQKKKELFIGRDLSWACE